MATHSSVLAWRIPGTAGAWWAAVYGVAQSQTRLKRLSSSSSNRGVTEIEVVGWHQLFDGHERGQALGDSEGQGGLVCCSPWDRKESDTTEQLS